MNTFEFNSFEAYILNQLASAQGFLLDPTIEVTNNDTQVTAKVLFHPKLGGDFKRAITLAFGFNKTNTDDDFLRWRKYKNKMFHEIIHNGLEKIMNSQMEAEAKATH